MKKAIITILMLVVTISVIFLGVIFSTDLLERNNIGRKLSYKALTDKVVYVLGDSIPGLEGSWVDNLAEKTGAKKVINCSRGGATWGWREDYKSYMKADFYTKPLVANTSADGKTVRFDRNSDLSNGNLPADNNSYTYINNELAFMQRLIHEGYEIPDVIIIACGINDTGVNTEVYSDELFESKFYTDRDSLDDSVKKTIGGGLRANIEALKDLYPDAVIVLSTPIQTPYAYFRPYVPNTCLWIKQFADYYSIPVIDAYNESGITTSTEKGWEDESYNGNNAGKYLFDGLHPNSDGYEVLSNFYAEKINELYFEYRSVSDESQIKQ